MGFYIRYPSASATANPSVGSNGSTAPTSSTQIAGVNGSGNLTPVSVDNAGNVNVVIAGGLANPLPVTDSTTHSELTTITANQTNGTQVTSVNNFPSEQNVNVNQVGGSAVSLGQKASTASIPVVVASDQSTLPVSAASLPLPTGASTSALQTSGNTSLVTIASNQTNGTQVTAINNFPATQPVSGTVAVSNFPVTQPVSGTVTANQGTANATPWNENIAQWGGSATTLGQKNMAASVPVVIASNQSSVPVVSTPVTPAALTVTQAAITVGTSAVRLTVSGSAPSATRVLLAAVPDHASAANFYIGSASVTSSGATRGVQLVGGQPFVANNDAGDYYIVSDTASQAVFVTEQS